MSLFFEADRALTVRGPAIPLIAGAPALVPLKLQGHEGINGLFAYRLILQTPDAYDFRAGEGSNFDLDAFVGLELTCTIKLEGHGSFVPGVPGGLGAHQGAGEREISGLVTHGGIVTEKMLIEDHATHHQKPILIDYAYQEGSLAVGYVMGLNSVSDYWDSAEHSFDDPLREKDFGGTSDGVAKQALRSGQPLSRKPLQDYAFRVEGHALIDVHQNFCRAWNRAPLLPKLAATSNAKAQAVRSADIDPLPEPLKLGKTGSPAERRLRLQVLRTQPTLDKDGVLMQDGKSLGLKVLVCKMATSNQTGQAALGASRDIYIHSKLLMVDDCFMTLGSANLNLRSMSADSEINLATDSIEHVRPFRQRVWGMQTGGEHDGGDGSPQKVSDTFEKWKKLASKNREAISQVNAFSGFLVQFEDTRTAMHRYG